MLYYLYRRVGVVSVGERDYGAAAQGVALGQVSPESVRRRSNCGYCRSIS